MKELIIGFHRWMLKHDTADNAEEYFHYTDEDMVREYLREVSTQDPDKIIDPEEERNDKIDRLIIDAYRRGWLAGYDEGLYDGQYK